MVVVALGIMELDVNKTVKLIIRNVKYIKTLLVVILLYSCNANEKRIQDSLFNIEGLDADIESVKNQGYNWEKGIDLIIYTKKANDTIISLELDNNLDNIIQTKTWKIKLESNNHDLIYKKMIEKGVFPYGPIAFYENSEDYFFTVIRNSDNNIFVCKVLKENNSNYLYITYHVPQ